MTSEQSSFRQMFEFPNEGLINKQRKYLLKGHRSKRLVHEAHLPQKETFYDVVQKAKNVAKFAQNLKQKIAENRSLDACTLKPNELQYLQNDSQSESKLAFFSHENKIILTIEAIYIAIVLLYLWQCTFEIVFGEMPTNEIINGITLVFYLIHIFLFQITEYKNQKSELIIERDQIRQIYLSEKIVKDSISLVVIMLQLTPLDNYEGMTPLFMVLRILSLLSYFELSATCEKVQNLLISSMHSQIMNSLLKLMFKLFLFLHILSMFLNLLSTIEKAFNTESTWLDNQNLVYGSNIEKYILGWYWGATILSTVGFGQIIPANNIERFVVSIVEVCCCMTFGYFVNAIGEIIKMRSQASEKYQKQIRKLNRYLNDLSLTHQLKHKIKTHYFNKHLVQQNHDPNQEKEVLNTITPNLKTSLLEQINIKIIKKCSPLQKFRDETIRNMAESIKRIILAPESILYSRNCSERKLWFIENGTVQQITDSFQHSKLKKIMWTYNSKDPLVGWINFVVPGAYKSMALAKNFTIAHQLDKTAFLQCFKSNVSQYHKFLQIQQRMIEKKKRFQSKCISCGRYTHNVIDCPRIHMVKKDGYKMAMQKKQLDRYLEEQNRKIDRLKFRCNWKCLFGTKELQREAQLLNKNQSVDVPQGTIENYLKKLAFRESVTVFQKKRASVMNVPLNQIKLQIQDQKELSKVIQVDRSMISFDSDQQQKGIQFQKAFYNKQFKSYMPLNDIEQILAEYHKKMIKKKLNLSCKELPAPPKQ